MVIVINDHGNGPERKQRRRKKSMQGCKRKKFDQLSNNFFKNSRRINIYKKYQKQIEKNKTTKYQKKSLKTCILLILIYTLYVVHQFIKKNYQASKARSQLDDLRTYTVIGTTLWVLTSQARRISQNKTSRK